VSRADLERVLAMNAAIAMRCLAAAEQAVVDGRFNVAKVLRACAHAARLAALTAARALAPSATPAAVLAETAALFEPDACIGVVTSSLRDVLRRALQSLEANRDILEGDVAQSLWGCQVCGMIVEGKTPGGCDHCGALPFEFDWFGPFYSGTFERLGRRRPETIAQIVRDSPARLAYLLDGAAEDRLARRPSPGEWCMKEIAGHLVDVTALFSGRARHILEAESPPSLEGPMPPWRLLESKRYATMPSSEIAELFGGATRDALALIGGLDATAWGRFGLMSRRVTTVLDLGTWLANHNIAHLAQIDALRAAPFRA
jgi:rubrerythrin